MPVRPDGLDGERPPAPTANVRIESGEAFGLPPLVLGKPVRAFEEPLHRRSLAADVAGGCCKPCYGRVTRSRARRVWTELWRMQAKSSGNGALRGQKEVESATVETGHDIVPQHRFSGRIRPWLAFTSPT